MKIFRRVIVVACVVLAAAAAARSAEAQLAYTVTVHFVPCGPGETDPCNRAVIETLNTATGQTVAAIDVWRNRSGWAALAVHPAGDRLYVMTIPWIGSPQETSFQVLNTSTWVEEAAFTIAGAGEDLAFSPGGARLFVARKALRDVAVIDTGSHTVIDSIPANFPTAVLVGRDGRVYVAQAAPTPVPNGYNWVMPPDVLIAVHDGASYGLLREVGIQTNSMSYSGVLQMTLSPDGSHLYAAVGESGVADVQLATGAVSIVPGLCPSPGPCDVAHGVAYARGKLYVAAYVYGVDTRTAFIAVVDPVTSTVVERLAVDDPLELIASPDESRVFVVALNRWFSIETSTDNEAVIGPAAVHSAGFAAPIPYKTVVIDAPAADAALRQPLTMSGWAVNVRGLGLEPGIDTIHVWAHPLDGSAPRFAGVATYGDARPDIAQLFGSRYLNTGFHVPIAGLPAGDYDLVAYARCAWTQEFFVSAARRVRVLPPQVHLVVDTPTNGSSVYPSAPISGWALDPAFTSGSGVDAVHVWAYPVTGGPPRFAGVATLSMPRPDVAAAFGPQFATAGWILPGETSNLPPGEYTLAVYARHVSTGVFLAERLLRVTVRPPVVMMAVDVPTAGASVPNPVRIAGWAIEYGVTTGSGVDAIHVWAAPNDGGAATFLGAAKYGGYRPDVAALFGDRFGPSAFELNTAVTLPAGTYTLHVFPHLTRLGAFGPARTVTVTVPARPEAPLAYLATVRADECRPGETAPCNRAVIETLNTATGQTVRSIDAWRNRSGVIEIAVHPAGDRLYVMTAPTATSGSQETWVQVLNTSTWVEEAVFTVAGVGEGLAFAPDGTRLFLTSSGSPDIAVIDSGTHTIVDGIPANRPFTVLVGRDGRVYVSHADNRITVHDGSSYALLQTISLPSPVFRMTLSTEGSHLYGAAGAGHVLDVELATGAVSVITSVGSFYAQDVAYARGKLYVAVGVGFPIGTSQLVWVFDPVTHRGLTAIPTGDEPLKTMASPDQSRVFVITMDRWLSIATSLDIVTASVPAPVGSVGFAAPSPYAALVIDTPPAGAALRQPFAMSGWAVNVRGLGLEPGIDTIHVYAHPVGGGPPRFVGVPTYGAARPDIAQLFGPRYLNAGFNLTVVGLPAGDYDLVAYARCVWTQTFSIRGGRRIRILPPDEQMTGQ